MNQPKKIHMVTFGIVYFLMFVLAIALNQDGKLILYPHTGQGFWGTWVLDSVIGIGIGLVVVSAIQIIALRSKVLQDVSDELYQMIGYLDVEEVFFLAFFSSVAEEFLFRGIIQAHLGLLLASVVFGVLHTAPGKKGRVWSLFAVAMGLVLGGSYMWRQSIFTPVWTHFVVNFCNVYLLQRKMKTTTDA